MAAKRKAARRSTVKARAKKPMVRRSAKVSAQSQAEAQRPHKFVVSQLASRRTSRPTGCAPTRTTATSASRTPPTAWRWRMSSASSAPCDPKVVSKEHLHEAEFQMIYVLKGSMVSSFDGHGTHTMKAGDAWLQPHSIKHKVLDYSDDCEVLEIVHAGELQDRRARKVEAAPALAAAWTPRPISPTAAEMIARARAMIPALRARAPQGERERRIAEGNHRRDAGGGAVPRAAAEALGRLRAATSAPISTSRWRWPKATCRSPGSMAWSARIPGDLSLFDDRAANDVWGKDHIDADLVVADAVRHRDAGAGRLSGQGRWKYSSGCEHCDWAFLGATVEGAAGGYPDRCLFLIPRKRLRDHRHLARVRPQGHRQPRHRGEGRVRAGAPDDPLFRQLQRRRAGPRGQHRRRSTGCRGARCSSAASRPASIGALQGMLDIFLEYGKSRVNRMFGTKAFDDPMVQMTCAEVAVGLDEMKTILHRNLRDPGRLCRARRDAVAMRAHPLQVPFGDGGGALQPCWRPSCSGPPAPPASTPTCRSAGSSPTSPRRVSTSRTSTRRSGATPAPRCSAPRRPGISRCNGLH